MRCGGEGHRGLSIYKQLEVTIYIKYRLTVLKNQNQKVLYLTIKPLETLFKFSLINGMSKSHNVSEMMSQYCTCVTLQIVLTKKKLNMTAIKSLWRSCDGWCWKGLSPTPHAKADHFRVQLPPKASCHNEQDPHSVWWPKSCTDGAHAHLWLPLLKPHWPFWCSSNLPT